MAFDRSGSSEAEPLVDRRRRLLDRGQRPDHAPLQPQPGDREVVDRPLRLRPPVRLVGDGDLAHRVLLDPCHCSRPSDARDQCVFARRVSARPERSRAAPGTAAASRRATMSRPWAASSRGCASAVVLALLGGPAGATTTTTRPRPPRRVHAVGVAVARWPTGRAAARPTSATVSTGTTGQAQRVTFRVQVGGPHDHPLRQRLRQPLVGHLQRRRLRARPGSGTVRATATGPGGSTESGAGQLHRRDCPA